MSRRVYIGEHGVIIEDGDRRTEIRRTLYPGPPPNPIDGAILVLLGLAAVDVATDGAVSRAAARLAQAVCQDTPEPIEVEAKVECGRREIPLAASLRGLEL